MQEGDAQVLLEARFNEAHGHPANAGTVFERIAKRLKASTRGRMRRGPHPWIRIREIIRIRKPGKGSEEGCGAKRSAL